MEQVKPKFAKKLIDINVNDVIEKTKDLIPSSGNCLVLRIMKVKVMDLRNAAKQKTIPFSQAWNMLISCNLSNRELEEETNKFIGKKIYLSDTGYSKDINDLHIANDWFDTIEAVQQLSNIALSFGVANQRDKKTGNYGDSNIIKGVINRSDKLNESEEILSINDYIYACQIQVVDYHSIKAYTNKTIQSVSDDEVEETNTELTPEEKAKQFANTLL